jgi:uncharacterized protein YigA (DUF484 family)
MDERKAITNINKSIARKFASIEAGISSSRDARELYEKLLLYTSEEFGIPYIWFSLIVSPDADGLIQQMESSESLKNRLNRVEAAAFEGLIQTGVKPLLANKNLKPFFKLLPKNSRYFLKSLAVAPVTLNGAVIGSLNFGDSDNRRYSPDMDTSLLSGLAEKFSILLTGMLSGGNEALRADKEIDKI